MSNRLFAVVFAVLMALAALAACVPIGGTNGPTIDDYRPGAKPKEIVQSALATAPAAASATATPPPAQPGSTTVNVTVNSDYNTGLMDVIAGTALVFGVFAVTILAIWIRNTRRNA